MLFSIKRLKSIVFALLLILSISGGISILTKSKTVLAAPTTFTVTNTNDTGAGSLRQAIISANTNGNAADQDIINFSINSDAPGTVVIEPQSTLTISQSVLINGYSQGDATVNTDLAPNPLSGYLRVELDLFDSGKMVIGSSNVTIQGLSMHSSPDYSIDVVSSNNFKLYGSYLNTDPTGLMPRFNEAGLGLVRIVNSDNVEIGGEQAARRNVLSWCKESCILAEGTSGQTTDNLVIKGNNIGVGSDSVTDQGGIGTGILLKQGTVDAIIGGDSSLGAGNNIMNCLLGGIGLHDDEDTTILGNRILSNSIVSNDPYFAGIFIGGSTNTLIGDGTVNGRNIISGTSHKSAVNVSNSPETNTPSSNITIDKNYIGVIDDGVTIYANNYDGILVNENAHDVLVQNNIVKGSRYESGVNIKDNANNVSVLRNSIYGNAGIGIDLAGDYAINDNDILDSDTGANNLLNSPGYTSIVEDAGDTEVTFTLDVPAGDYRIEFFSNTDPEFNSNPGEGETFIGSVNVTSTGTGIQEFTHTLSGINHDNMALTATEIDNSTFSGFGATSEFGTEGAPYFPYADLSVTTSLDNPNDIGLTGDIATISITVTNTGPNSYNLEDLNSPTPAANILFLSLLPPELSFSGISGSDVTCTDFGPGSAGGFGPTFQNHTDYGALTCGYTGGSGTLASGQSRSFIISATVMSPRDSSFQIFTFLSAPESDPDFEDFGAIFISGDDAIDGFTALNGSINNFSSITFSHNYVSDMSTSKVLLNPEDFATGNVLNYQITVTNNGPDPLDLNLYDTPAPGQDNFLMDILPAHLAFSTISGTGIVCNDLGPGSAGFFGPILGNHSDHSVVACASDGNSPVLNSGESISYTLSAEVLDDSEPIFYNHVFANVNYGDPDQLAVGAISGSGSDLLDGLQSEGINNYAAAYSQPANASVTKTLNNPEDVAAGATLNYSLTFTNNGPYSIDPTVFDGSGINPLPNSLFVDLMPPNLSYVSQSNPDLNCTWLGPGSASITGPVFGNHSDYSLLICVYSGSVTDLANSQSISTTIATTANTVPSSFANYLISPGSSVDPDNSFLRQQLSGAGNYDDGDALDNILASEVNNAVLAAYTAPPSEETPPTDPGSGNSSNGGSSNSGSGSDGLTVTGQTALTALALTVLVVSVVLIVWLKRSRRNS